MNVIRWLSRCKRIGLLALAAFLALAVVPATASADFSFTEANFTNNTVSSPYAEVGITGDTSTGTVTFKVDVLGNPATFGTFGFNYTGGTFPSSAVASYTITGTGGDASGWTLGSGSNMDGYGSFVEASAPPNSGAADRLSTMTLTIQFTAGNFGDAAASNFEVTNSSGQYFALEYFPNSGNTGFVAVNSLDTNPGGGAVPAPPSVVLLGVGGLCLAGFMVRSRRRLAAAA